MLCRQRRGWSGALSSVWGSASNLSTQSGRVPPNGDSLVARRGTGPHQLVVFVIGHRGPNAQLFGSNRRDKARDNFASWAATTIGSRCTYTRRRSSLVDAVPPPWRRVRGVAITVAKRIQPQNSGRSY